VSMIVEGGADGLAHFTFFRLGSALHVANHLMTNSVSFYFEPAVGCNTHITVNGAAAERLFAWCEDQGLTFKVERQVQHDN
jgi:hypothetical protein